MSTTHNTLQNYLEKYINKTLGDKFNGKLYKELLHKVEAIIKQAINEVRHQDDNLERAYHNKKLVHAIAKQYISSSYQASKRCLDSIDNYYPINENSLKLLEREQDMVDKIHNISLLQPNKENETLNIRKTLAHSIPLQCTTVEKYRTDIEKQF